MSRQMGEISDPFLARYNDTTHYYSLGGVVCSAPFAREGITKFDFDTKNQTQDHLCCGAQLAGILIDHGVRLVGVLWMGHSTTRDQLSSSPQPGVSWHQQHLFKIHRSVMYPIANCLV